MKSILVITLIFITGCQRGFLGADPSSMDRLEGEWTWSDGTDSLWVQLEKGEPFSFNDHEGKDTTFSTISGIYNLYRDGKLITGNHESQTMYGFFYNTKTEEILVSSQPDASQGDRIYVSLTSLTRNRLKWEISERRYIGGIRVRSSNDPPFPKSIPGFRLPNNIVLTRLKE